MVISWWLFIITKGVIAHIRNEAKFSDFTGVEATMRTIIKSCYSNYNGSNPILILGDIDDVIDESIFDTRPVSIISMDDSVGLDENTGNKSWNFKPKMIVLAGDAPEKLQSDLSLLKRTRWWNYRAHFFILGRVQNQCDNSKEILTITSKMDILMAIYVCLNSQNMPELYTANPITNYAIPPWEKIEDSEDLNIYRQLFDPNISCRNLDYDKTKFLNGYGIKGVIAGPLEWHHMQNRNRSDLIDHVMDQFEVKLFKNISIILNATFVPEIEPPGESPMQRVGNGTADVSMNFASLEWYPERQFLFQHMWTRIVAVRKSDPHLSTFQKICHLWSVPVQIGAMFTLSTFFLVLICENRGISSAILEIIRLLTYVSIRTTRNRLSFRILFAVMLMLVVISNGVFQGSISAFLTKPQHATGINTIQELRELNYTLYTLPGTRKYARRMFPSNPAIEVSPARCPEYLWNTSRAVCLTVKELFYDMWADRSVTLVREPIKTTYLNNKCRDDWSLYERVNNVVVQLVESGLVNHWLREMTHGPMLKRKVYDMELLSPKYEPVKLEALDFAFKLLAIGLSLSLVVFLLEIVVKQFDVKFQ